MTILQYCRYCEHSRYCEAGIWCSIKNKIIADSTAKSVNHCAKFVLNPIDVFAPEHNGEPHLYSPKKETNKENQVSIFDLLGVEE